MQGPQDPESVPKTFVKVSDCFFLNSVTSERGGLNYDLARGPNYGKRDHKSDKSAVGSEEERAATPHLATRRHSTRE